MSNKGDRSVRLLVFLTSLVLNIAIFGMLIYQYQVINALQSRYDEVRELLSLASYPNIAILSQHTLRYKTEYTRDLLGVHVLVGYSTPIRGICGAEGPFTATIYIPRDDAILEIEAYFWGVHPQPDFVFHLSIQRGDVYETSGPHPVIWMCNMTGIDTYRVEIPSRGWYTFSILGPIEISGEELMFHPPRFSVEGWRVSFSFYIRVEVDGEPIPFALKNHEG
jgi:hypothetical protein